MRTSLKEGGDYGKRDDVVFCMNEVFVLMIIQAN